MKYLKLKYPNNIIHNIIIKNLYKLNSQYFITYYDLTEHTEKNSYIIEENDKYYKDEDIELNELEELITNSESINTKILPKEIFCNKKIKKINTKRNKKLFIVYDTELGTYLNCELCRKYNVGDKNTKNFIEGHFCYKINDEDITKIEDITKNSTPYLKAFHKIICLKPKKYFTVYIINNKFYVEEEMCAKYNIGDKTKYKFIRNTKCINVSKQEISKIEQDNIKASYNQLFQTQTKESFTVYKTETGLYLKEELCKKFNIESNDIQTIEGFNCYKVNENDIQKIEELTINADPKLTRRYRHIKIDTFIILSAKSGLYIEEDIQKKYNIISKKTKTFNNKKYKQITLDDIKKIEKLANTKAKYQKIEQKQTSFIVYNDLTSLYIDEYIANLFKINTRKNSQYINNTKYVEISQTDVDYIENITKNLDTYLQAKYVELKK